jgi:hypothetical protein
VNARPSLRRKIKAEPFHAPRVANWMSSAEKTTVRGFTSFAWKDDRDNGRSSALRHGIRLQNMPRSLQHIGTTAKKCPVLASRSPDSEATAAFTTLKAHPGRAKVIGFSLAGDFVADGGTPMSVKGRGGAEPSIRAAAHPA